MHGHLNVKVKNPLSWAVVGMKTQYQRRLNSNIYKGIVQIIFFWFLTTCRIINLFRRFGGTCYLHLQNDYCHSEHGCLARCKNQEDCNICRLTPLRCFYDNSRLQGCMWLLIHRKWRRELLPCISIWADRATSKNCSRFLLWSPEMGLASSKFLYCQRFLSGLHS